jgi:hypothetical protein
MLQAKLYNGVGDVSVTLPESTTKSEAQSVVDALNAQNARIFKVTIISTFVVGFAALLNSYRMIKQLKRDEVLFSRKLAKR